MFDNIEIYSSIVQYIQKYTVAYTIALHIYSSTLKYTTVYGQCYCIDYIKITRIFTEINYSGKINFTVSFHVKMFCKHLMSTDIGEHYRLVYRHSRRTG